MSIRRQPLITGQYYHIYNRGVDKRDIFTDKNDIHRFLESIKEFNRVEKISSLANLHKAKKLSKIAAGPLSENYHTEPLVEIVSYCLNPNHFHFVLRQSVDSGISKFMHKLQGGYVSYFNNKNSRAGVLFQGAFKSQIITDQNYFNRIIGYVNKNYQIHNIPENKNHLVFAGDFEYESNDIKIISQKEKLKIIDFFGGSKNFKKHCDEIVFAIREERGKKSLLEDEDIPR